MIDSRFAPYGAFALRLALGSMWLSHGLMKFFVFTPAGFAGFLASQGMPASLAWPIILGEILGGLAILFGVYGRLVSVVLLPVLLGAFVVHFGNGWVFSVPNGGWEYPAFLVMASLVHAAIGDGAFALRTRGLSFSHPVPA